ncbi:MAG: nitroreductase family protein [Candidatus Thermoplasmatota archaeon]|jgi:nitroreductase|nr:nitroreductase family protein [Candidatus Thermoplasmatota archaeon]
MDVYDAIVSRRSIRRFQQKPIKIELLKKFVNAARLAPSAANLQPLEYFIVTDKELCSKIFETIGWVAYITPKWTPSLEERPTAYIIILVKDLNNKYYERDVGLASENIVLAAEGEGIGSCILCNIDRDKIRDILKIPDDLHIDSLISLGYKAEQPVVEDLKDSVKYWRDKNGVLHVPKRRLEDIIHINKF